MASRPGRPRGATLTAEHVFDAALDLTEHDGLGAVTVQGLADRLSVGRATVYHHVGSLDAVHDVVCDRVVAMFPAPATDSADWRGWYEELLVGARHVMARFDGVSRRIRTLGPRSPHQLALVERATGVLVEAGFTARTAALGYAVLIAATCDSVELAELHKAENSTGSPARTDWRRLVETGAVTPAFGAVLTVYIDVTNDDLFRFTIRTSLDGLHGLLQAERDATTQIDTPSI